MIVTNKRTQLSAKHVNSLTFLNVNLEKIEKALNIKLCDLVKEENDIDTND